MNILFRHNFTSTVKLGSLSPGDFVQFIPVGTLGYVSKTQLDAILNNAKYLQGIVLEINEDLVMLTELPTIRTIQRPVTDRVIPLEVLGVELAFHNPFCTETK